MAQNYYCSNCRENIKADSLKKVPVGQDRNVVFCGTCNCYVALEEPKAKAPAPAAPATKPAE